MSGPRFRCPKYRTRSPAHYAFRKQCHVIMTSTSAAAMASSAVSTVRSRGASRRRVGRPVRFIEDRLENMRSGDAHGPEHLRRRCRVQRRRVVKSMKIALSTMPAPMPVVRRSNWETDRRHRRSLQDRACSTARSRSPPTRRCRRPCVASVRRRRITPLKPQSTRWRLRSTFAISASPQFHPQGEFPYLIPSGSTYVAATITVVESIQTPTSGDGAERDRLPRPACLRASALRPAWPSGGNSSFEPLLNEEYHHDLDGFLPHQYRCPGPLP